MSNLGKTFVITGGTPLYGSVRVGGAKNASYKLMIAALLASSESRLLNLPDISDVELVSKIINELGAQSRNVGERTYYIQPQISALLKFVLSMVNNLGLRHFLFPLFWQNLERRKFLSPAEIRLENGLWNGILMV